VADDFFSFDEALDELRLKEEELKRLVSEGEIRAFREGDTMRLRRTDVESLRAELSGGEVVDLGEATEELVFEDDADLEDEAGMATQEIADVDTIIEDDIEDVGELELDDEVEEARPVRRQSAIAAAAVEDEAESVGIRAALILTSLILVLTVPIMLSMSTGNLSSIAKSIGSIFAKSLGGE
jgi:excisionase family DNA binding protein